MKAQLLEQFKKKLDNASSDELGQLKRTVSDASSKADTMNMMRTLAVMGGDPPENVSPKNSPATTKPPRKKKAKAKGKRKLKSPKKRKNKEADTAHFNQGTCHYYGNIRDATSI